MKVGVISGFAINKVRQMAERQMVDVIKITRPAAPTFDNTTGLVTSHRKTDIYTGKARINLSSGPQPQQLGDGIILFQTTPISIPYSVDGIRRDDLVTVVACGHSATVGNVYRIIGTNSAGDLGAVQTLTCTDEEPSSFEAS